MARDLAPEGRVLLAHAVLDVCVPDAVHERDAAGALDRLRHRPARAHVVDDLRARLLLEDDSANSAVTKSPGTNSPRVVDEEAAVGVAVEGHAEVGLLLERLAHDELAVLGQERVRLVVREGAVGLEVAAHDLDLGQPLEHAREHHAGHAVRRVGHDLSGLTASGSMNESTRSTNCSQMSYGWTCPGVCPRACPKGPARGRGCRAGPTRRRPGALRCGRSSCPCIPSGCARRSRRCRRRARARRPRNRPSRCRRARARARRRLPRRRRGSPLRPSTAKETRMSCPTAIFLGSNASTKARPIA